MLTLEITNPGHGDGAGFGCGKTVGSATDGRESHTVKAMLASQVKTGTVTSGQYFPFALSPASPDRPDSVNHVFRRQPVPPGYPRLPSRASPNGATFGQKLGAGCTVNGAIHPASAQK
jgi:hypothetical protein